MAPKLVRVGIAVVEHNKRYLVGVRGPTGPLAGYDEFPGGKCIANETAAAFCEANPSDPYCNP